MDEQGLISYDDFKKVRLVVGKVLEVQAHPNADKLLVVKVDVGDAQLTLVAGIRQFYADSDLIGKNVVVARNLEPRIIRGVESRGMLLAASNEQGFSILTLDREIVPGAGIK
jgi:methionyl-tRNA synthetase